MNIHPMLVHFPIAFLSVYSVLELVRLRYITSLPYWFYIKASIVIIGTAGAGAAYLAGEAAEELVGGSSLIETHSQWAKASVVLFGLIAASYAVVWLTRLEIFDRIENTLNLKNIRLYTFAKGSIVRLVESSVMILPALVGLVCITVTGALGGAIVYGAETDPVVRFIYSLVIGS